VYSKTDPRIFYAERPDQFQMLDLCDPVWIESPGILRDALELVHIVTLPTAAMLNDFHRAMGPFPGRVVRDGHNLDCYRPGEKIGPHYAWFGYSQNWPAEGGVMRGIPEDDLLVVSDLDPGYGRFHRWQDDRAAFAHIAQSKIAVIPEVSPLKSNNRAITAWALGLAVAKTPEDLIRLETDEAIEQDVQGHQRVVRHHSAQEAANDWRKAINGGGKALKHVALSCERPLPS